MKNCEPLKHVLTEEQEKKVDLLIIKFRELNELVESFEIGNTVHKFHYDANIRQAFMWMNDAIVYKEEKKSNLVTTLQQALLFT